MFWQNICLLMIFISRISGIWSAAARNASIIQSRNVGGIDADINKAKFIVSVRLYSEYEKNPNFKCGGSLISNNVVLTAAHCLFDFKKTQRYHRLSDIYVVMGNPYIMDVDVNTLHFDIEGLWTNPYNGGFEHDIALLFLKDNVPKDHPTANPVNLVTKQRKDGIICKAYGWGRTSNGNYATKLQVVDLPLINYETCAEDSSYGDEVKEGMICAGDLIKGGVGTGSGDSGGPLVCDGIQIGVDSWHKGKSGSPGNPSVFTHLLVYKSYIEKHIFLHRATQPKFESILH